MPAFLFSNNMMCLRSPRRGIVFLELRCQRSPLRICLALGSIATPSRNRRDVRSAGGDGTHVYGDEERLRDALVVAVPGVASSCGGDGDAVDVAIVAGVEHSGRPANDVDGEVMSA